MTKIEEVATVEAGTPTAELNTNNTNTDLIIAKKQRFKQVEGLFTVLETELNKRLFGFNGSTIFVLEKKVVYPKNFSKFWSYLKSEYRNEFIKYKFIKWDKKDTVGLKSRVADLYNVLEMKQHIDDIEQRYDLFLDDIKIDKANKKLIIYNNKYEFIKPKSERIDYLTDEQKDEIVKDYKNHFEELDEILEWMIAVNFSGEKRSSFLNLHFFPAFGKSFFMDLFTDLEMGFITKPEKLAKTPCDHKISEISGKLVMIVDEFITFKKELKEMTHAIRTRELYGFEQKVELGAKLFLNAEKSHSFVDGVDNQILDRVNYIRKDNSIKLEDREVFQKFGNKTYFYVIAEYVYNKMISKINYYLRIGRKETDLESTKVVKDFNKKYTLRKNAIDLVKVIKDLFIDEMNEVLAKSDETCNLIQKQIKELIFTDDENNVYIRKITKVMELILKDQDIVMQKKGFYKLSDIENVLGTETKTKWINNRNIKCCKFEASYFQNDNNEDLKELRKELHLGKVSSVSSSKKNLETEEIEEEIVEEFQESKIYDENGEEVSTFF